MALKLSGNQLTFASTLQQETGLSLPVIQAWLAAEQGNENANPASSGLYNFLNVGVTGGGNFGTGDSIWNNPVTAAKATAAWLKGQPGAVPGYGPASGPIQAIAKTAGQSPQAQIAAIQYHGTGGWSTGGEPALPGAYSQATGGVTPTGLSQSQILQKLGYPAGSLNTILQSGKAMQAANTEAALKGLPQPFTTSAGSALTQDLLPLAAIFGAAGLPEAGTAAADATAAGDATAGATASGAAATVGALNKLSTAGGIAAAFELFKGYLPHLLVYGGLMVLGFALLLTAARRQTGLTVSPGISPHVF